MCHADLTAPPLDGGDALHAVTLDRRLPLAHLVTLSALEERDLQPRA